jgi:hypothetical protein
MRTPALLLAITSLGIGALASPVAAAPEPRKKARPISIIQARAYTASVARQELLRSQRGESMFVDSQHPTGIGVAQRPYTTAKLDDEGSPACKIGRNSRTGQELTKGARVWCSFDLETPSGVPDDPIVAGAYIRVMRTQGGHITHVYEYVDPGY